MLNEKQYDRIAAVMYARKWALSRNPLFEDYAGIGGDCTSFASQCHRGGRRLYQFRLAMHSRRMLYHEFHAHLRLVLYQPHKAHTFVVGR